MATPSASSALPDRLIRPASVAVLGASATRKNNGNVVVTNLRAVGYHGAVFPIHATAPTSKATLPCARSRPSRLVSTSRSSPSPPPASCRCCRRSTPRGRLGDRDVERLLPRRGNRPAGVVPQQPAAGAGPELHGLLNLSDPIPLYTAIPSARLRPGRAALSPIRLRRHLGDELHRYRLLQGDHLRQPVPPDRRRFPGLARDDPATAVMGIVIESIPDPDRFADASTAPTNGKASWR